MERNNYLCNFFYSKTEEYRKIEKQHQNNTQKEENRGF